MIVFNCKTVSNKDLDSRVLGPVRTSRRQQAILRIQYFGVLPLRIRLFVAWEPATRRITHTPLFSGFGVSCRTLNKLWQANARNAVDDIFFEIRYIPVILSRSFHFRAWGFWNSSRSALHDSVPAVPREPKLITWLIDRKLQDFQ